jgi:hypothetical protein
MRKALCVAILSVGLSPSIGYGGANVALNSHPTGELWSVNNPIYTNRGTMTLYGNTYGVYDPFPYPHNVAKTEGIVVFKVVEGWDLNEVTAPRSPDPALYDGVGNDCVAITPANNGPYFQSWKDKVLYNVPCSYTKTLFPKIQIIYWAATRTTYNDGTKPTYSSWSVKVRPGYGQAQRQSVP